MGLFSSKSSTTQTQETINNNTQVSTGDISGVYVGGNNNAISVTDGGAVRVALDFAGGVTESIYKMADNVLQFSGGALSQYGSLAGSAIESVNRSQDNAYQFSAGLVNKTIDAVVQSVDGQRQANRDVLEYGAGITRLALDSADTARSDSLQFAAGAFKEASSTQQKALELNKQFATETYNQIAQANAGAAAAVSAANENAMQFTSGAFTKALDNVSTQSKSYAAALTDFADKTIATAVQSTKSESAQATDKIIDLTQNTTKYILWAVGGLGALLLLFARAK